VEKFADKVVKDILHLLVRIDDIDNFWPELNASRAVDKDNAPALGRGLEISNGPLALIIPAMM
jgi:hypothetical protein